MIHLVPYATRRLQCSRRENDLRNYSATHVLSNGTTILIRAVRPDDRPRFRAAFASLDRNSIYKRFLGYKKELTDAELEHATEVDFDRVVALVATVGSGDAETIIAGARYVSESRLCSAFARRDSVPR